MSPEEVKQAVRELPESADYVWDGENDRPATAEELQAALAAFRASGPGWQTRMNDALRQWLQTHPQK